MPTSIFRKDQDQARQAKVLADGAVIGRIMEAVAAPEGTPWMWTARQPSAMSRRTRGDGRIATRELGTGEAVRLHAGGDRPGGRARRHANFVVDWSSPEAIDEPVVEAVMFAVHGTQGYSLVSPGRRVTRP